MKRIFCFLLVLLLLTPATYADTSSLPTLNLKLSAPAALVGDTVRVTVSVENAPTCASYHIIYSYDTSVLQPIEGKNISTGGLFTTNINPKEKGTINTVAADASKVIAGNLQLFYTDFKVIGAPGQKESSTPLKVTYQEFYTPEMEKLTNVRINPCNIPIIDPNAKDEPSVETPTPPVETPTPEPPASEPDLPAPEPDKNITETPKEEGPMNNLPPESDWNKPTGNWQIDEEKQQATLTTPDGKKETYDYEAIIDETTGNLTNLILFDKDGHQAGGLQIEQDQNGKFSVLQQTFSVLEPGKFDKDNSTLLYYLIPIGAAVVIGVVLLVIGITKVKSKDGAEK